MFEAMNKVKNIAMIDYKTFLTFVNSENNPKTETFEKFDWVEDTLAKIKSWYKSSNLTLEDAFKIIDKDSDTYLNEKDIIAFLT